MKPFVKFYPLGEPLVFKTVKGVKEALVDKVDSGSNDLDGKQSKDLALDQKYDLHHDREDSVSNHDREGQVDERPSLR